MFEKAWRKVDETKFFLSELQDEEDPNKFEFRFNALLSAGKNVVYMIHAQIRYTEQNRPRQSPATEEDLKKTRKAVYDAHFDTWKNGRSAEERDLFDVLQKLRDVEVHEKDPVSQLIPRREEREEWRRVPSDPHYGAVFAQYMAMGMLSSKVTTFKTTYTYEFDPNALSDQDLLERFKTAQRGKNQLEIGLTYVDLLTSVVDYFSANYK